MKAVAKISNNFKSVPAGIKAMIAADGEAERKIEESILKSIIAGETRRNFYNKRKFIFFIQRRLSGIKAMIETDNEAERKIEKSILNSIIA